MRNRAVIFIFSVLAAALLPFVRMSAHEVDSLDRYQGLDSLLTQFYLALEPESIEVKNAEFDGLIASCHDSLTRQNVTLQIFDHYRYSRVMGEEAVAIHVFDEWVASGKVKTRSEFEQMDDELFVEFNRRSLLGMTAAPVTLLKPCGAWKTVPLPGKINVLFFYDTQCAKCRLEWQYMPAVLEEVDFPMEFCAVYVGSDRKDWRKFRKTLKVHNRNVKILHLWDPEVDSDYQRYYAVIGTPRVFLVMEDGEILGRRLEVANLQELIRYISIRNESKE